MSFPVTIDPASPAGTDPKSQGDDQFRALKQAIIDIFGLPSSPSSISAAASIIGTDGTLSSSLRLTNKTGGALVAGDVVTIDASNDSAVALDNTLWSVRPFVVSLESIADNASGLFAYSGAITTVNCTGAIARGQYLRKSATTKVVEDHGLAHNQAGRGRPYGALGIALAAASGGVVKALWFGNPPTTGVVAVSLGETTTTSTGGVTMLTFSNLNIPATACWALNGLVRKTSGAAASGSLGIGINGSQIFSNGAVLSATNQAEQGYFELSNAGARATNYTQSMRLGAYTSLAGSALVSFGNVTFTNQLPTGAITTIAITGLVGSASITLGIANIIVVVFEN